MNNFNIYTIYLDGIDKCGKDSILPYIGPLCNYKYICNIRGIMTQLAYSKLYNRDYNYNLTQQEHVLNVYLTVDKEDWKIRCNINNEPDIVYEDNVKVFNDAYNELLKNGFNTLKINTSKYSQYEIAKQIVKRMDELNADKNN